MLIVVDENNKKIDKKIESFINAYKFGQKWYTTLKKL